MLWPLLLPLLWAGSLAQKSKFQMTVPSSVEVEEGLCVLVLCSVLYPSSPSSTASVFGYWFQDGANTQSDSPVATNNPNRQVKETSQGQFQLVGDPQNKNCSLLIKDARPHDSGVYFFRVESGSGAYSFQQNKVSVKVLVLMKAPDIQVPVTLNAGQPSKMTCSAPWACEQGTPPVFSWVHTAFTSMDPRTIHLSELTFTPKPQAHGTNLTCQVTLPGVNVTVEKTVQLNVLYAPEKLTILVYQGQHTGAEILRSNSSLQVQEGEFLRLVCVADSNPPASLSWDKGTLRSTQGSTQEVLQLPRVTFQDQGKYICRAQHILGTGEASVSLIVRSRLQLLGPSCSWEAQSLLCSCSCRAWPAPSLRWRLGEGLLEGNSSNNSITVTSTSTGPLANSSLKLHEGLSATGLRLSCEASNDHEAQRVTILLLHLEDNMKGKPGARTGMVEGAILGAGTTILLAACLAFIVFIVRTYWTKSAKKAASRDHIQPSKRTSYPVCPPSVYVTHPNQGHLNASRSHSPEDTPPKTTTATPGKEPELHYASLGFQGLKTKTRQPRDPEHAHCEYSEIKIHKP